MELRDEIEILKIIKKWQNRGFYHTHNENGESVSTGTGGFDYVACPPDIYFALLAMTLFKWKKWGEGGGVERLEHICGFFLSQIKNNSRGIELGAYLRAFPWCDWLFSRAGNTSHSVELGEQTHGGKVVTHWIPLTSMTRMYYIINYCIFGNSHILKWMTDQCMNNNKRKNSHLHKYTSVLLSHWWFDCLQWASHFFSSYKCRQFFFN